MGSGWRRQFRLVIPVRSPDHWSSRQVIDSLSDVLTFLSDDDFRFEFAELTKPPLLQSYLDLEHEGPSSFQADKVLLFSGGMDSLAGAVDELSRGSRVVLVSHQSSPKMHKRQRHLASELAQRFPNKVFHVPVGITKRGWEAVENTQRTRTFLFCALGIAVARMVRRNHVRFYENGVISLNLPIASQVVGARATRTTHPRVLHDLSRFLTELLGTKVGVDNPFIGKTKTEVATAIGSSGHADLIAHSVSCTRVHRMTTLHTHCGACSQCLDRRFAVLAAGLQDHDPAEMYGIDLLTGAREDGEERTMAEAMVRHALEFRRMNELAFVGQYAGELSRASSCYPGTTPDQAAEQIFDLHRRHGEVVYRVLENGIKTFAGKLVDKTLPASCLLRMAVQGHASAFDETLIRDPVEARDADAAADDTRDFHRSSEIQMSLDEQARRVVFDGLPPIEGRATYSLLDKLAATHREDTRVGRSPVNYRYTLARVLADVLSIEEATLRRRVSRFRQRIADLFVRHFGFPLAQDAVIETREWKGYRLNPGVRVLALSEIRRAASQVPAQPSRLEGTSEQNQLRRPS